MHLVEARHIRPDLSLALRVFLTFPAKLRDRSSLAVFHGGGVADVPEQFLDLGFEIYSSKGPSSSASRDTPVDSKATIATAQTTSGAFFTSCSFQSSR
jgi:hypothetical protein